MHPPLFRPHPLCEEYVKLLVRCHDDNPYKKFFGACNDAKAAMDICFREEKEVKRRENQRRAREEELRFESLVQKLEKK